MDVSPWLTIAQVAGVVPVPDCHFFARGLFHAVFARLILWITVGIVRLPWLPRLCDTCSTVPRAFSNVHIIFQLNQRDMKFYLRFRHSGSGAAIDKYVSRPVCITMPHCLLPITGKTRIFKAFCKGPSAMPGKDVNHLTEQSFIWTRTAKSKAACSRLVAVGTSRPASARGFFLARLVDNPQCLRNVTLHDGILPQLAQRGIAQQ